MRFLSQIGKVVGQKVVGQKVVVGQKIVVCLDNGKWPAEVVGVSTTGKLRVKYRGCYITTVVPSEVVSYDQPFADMPPHLSLAHYEIAFKYRYGFYVYEWGKTPLYPPVEWRKVDDGVEVLVVEDGVCKTYLCTGVSTPNIHDGFEDKHTKTQAKHDVNEQFARLIKDLDPKGQLNVFILDTGNTSRTLRANGVQNPIVVVNPDETLELPEGVEHQVCTMREFLSCNFIQDGYKEGHIGLDYTCEFTGCQTMTLPKADMKFLIECVFGATSNRIASTAFWTTQNMRHLPEAKRATHIADVFSFLQQEGEPLGFNFVLKYSLRYGARNEMVSMIFEVNYQSKHRELSAPVVLETKRKPQERDFLVPDAPDAKRARAKRARAKR